MASKKQEYYVKKFGMCDRNHFWIIKGIAALAALAAMFCSIFLKMGDGTHMERMATAVFVLCSGFGVSESFQKKNGLVHFWENKLIRVWIPSVVVVIAFNIINVGNIASWIAHKPLGFKGPMLYVIFGGYGVFWAIFQTIDNKNARILGMFACAAAAFAFIPEDPTISAYALKTYLMAFPVGVMLSQINWKRAMTKAKTGIRILVLAACIVVAVGFWFLADILTIPYVHTLLLSVCYLAAAMALMMLTFCLQKIQIWGIFAPFGIISYAMYLMYDGIFAKFLGKTDPKMYAVMFVVVIAVSALFSWLRELLISWNYKMRRKGKAHLKGSMG